jgi:DNA-binding NtrC family response regulator
MSLTTSPKAQGKLGRKEYDVVVTDLVMEGRREGLDVMRAALAKTPPPPVVLVTAHADIPTCNRRSRGGV